MERVNNMKDHDRNLFEKYCLTIDKMHMDFLRDQDFRSKFKLLKFEGLEEISKWHDDPSKEFTHHQAEEKFANIKQKMKDLDLLLSGHTSPIGYKEDDPYKVIFSVIGLESGIYSEADQGRFIEIALQLNSLTTQIYKACIDFERFILLAFYVSRNDFSK